MTDLDLTETTRIVNVPMATLVFGPAPRPRFPARLVFVAAVFLASVGCATSGRPIQVEAVGELTASATHVSTAPLKHDAPPEMGGVAGTDDDVQGDTSLDVLRREAEKAGAVDIAAKTDGVVVGEVR